MPHPTPPLTGRRLLLCHALLVVVAAGLLSACISSFGVPIPRVHDEFAYKLLGQTLAAGRWTNPTPAHPEFLESFHVLMKPTYNAKYLPGQALPLALGELLGHPMLGLWLVGLLLVPLGFELFRRVSNDYCGGAVALFVYLRFFLFTYFGHSYWGGALFMLCGGAMLLGVALYRDGHRLAAGLVFGPGAGLCLMTRPFEGFFWGLVCLACLITIDALGWRRQRRWNARGCATFLAVVIACLLMSGGVLLVHNDAVTGDWRQLPYTIYGRDYMPSYRDFIWQERPHPIETVDKPEVFNEFVRERAAFNRMGTAEFLTFGLTSFRRNIEWLFPYYSVFPFAAVVLFLLIRRDPLGLLALGFLLAMLTETVITTNNTWPHYYAPWVWISGGFWSLVLIHGSRLRWFDTPHGRSAAIAVPPTLLVVVLGACWIGARNEPKMLGRWMHPLAEYRALTEQNLRALHATTGQRQLVFVETTPAYESDFEFVYNGPDPHGAPVLWARSLGRDRDRVLKQYARDRRCWLMRLGGQTGLLPYP